MKRLTLFLLFLSIFSIQQTTEGPASPYMGNVYHVYDHDWSTPEDSQEKGDYLRVYASKQATKTRNQNGNTTTYSTHGSASAEAVVSTELMRVGDEWQCTSWIQATSAQGLTSSSKNLITASVRGSAYTYRRGSPYTTNLGKAESIVSFKRGMARVFYSKGGIIPSGDIIRKDFRHQVGFNPSVGSNPSAEGAFSSVLTPSDLPDLNPWAHVEVGITGRAHASTEPQINRAEASTPKCIRIDKKTNEEHPIPLGHGAKCPGRPGEDYTSPSDEIINQQAVAPSSDPSTTPSTVTYACGIHSGDPNNASSDHSTLISGYSGSFYECQSHQTYGCGHKDLNNNSSSHALQASCSQTDSYGQGCTVTNFYACQTHTHQYPALVSGACGHTYTSGNASSHSLQASCLVTNANGDSCTVTGFYACASPHTHQYPAPTATCANGHTYNPTITSAKNNHRTRTCRFAECGQTWERCVSPTPICNKPYRKRNGLRCWKIE